MTLVHDHYEDGPPSTFSAMSIFKDQWVSAIPNANVGTIPLFQDARVAWAIEQAGGVSGKKILELGPLEGGHSYMLHKAGAGSILALEANSLCYMKCLVVKEALGINSATFQYGNFVPWLIENKEKFDYIHASGVLYHMVDPVQLVDLLCTRTNQIYIWTHYADIEKMPANDPRYQAGIVKIEAGYAHGREYKLYRRQYHRDPTTDPTFCGGVHRNPAWIEKSMIIHVLAQHGFAAQLDHDTPDHPGGPCCSIFAQKAGS